MVKVIRGDIISGRDVTINRPVTFYFISSMEGYMDIVKGEMNRLRWIWADVAYNEYRGEFR